MGFHDDITAEREAATPNAKKIKAYRRYARGRHRTTLNPQQKRILRNLIGNLFCDNVVARILGELRNRLRLARFDSDGGEEQSTEQLLQYMSTLWTLNNMGELANQVHWSLLRDGDHAVSLNHITTASGDARVTLRRELWWNGKTGMWIAYNDNGRPKYAVKEWDDDGNMYRTVYERGRIRRFRKNGNGWKPYSLPTDPDEGGEGTVYWTSDGTAGGEPIGLPVVHFRNTQVPQDPECGSEKDAPDPMYGSSELDGGLLGLQDEVNDVHRDITSSARYAGFPMTYGTGVDQPLDEEGNPTEYRPEPGAFFRSSNSDAKFGRIKAGSIETLKETLKVKLEAMSRASSVPMFAIQGNWPSGEALIRAEMPLIDKVETIADSVGPAWSSVMHKATRLHNVFGGGSIDESIMIDAVFSDPRRRDRATQAEVAKKISEFVSRKEVLRTLNYTPSQIAQIMDELEEEREQMLQENDAFVEAVMERRQSIEVEAEASQNGSTS